MLLAVGLVQYLIYLNTYMYKRLTPEFYFNITGANNLYCIGYALDVAVTLGFGGYVDGLASFEQG